MSIDIRFPNIDSTTEAGQLRQMKSYLYQLVEQLNFALSSIETSAGSNTSNAVLSAKTNKPLSQEESQSTFNAIKGLIIKSADIVKAYSDEITSRLDGLYVAESDFGTFKQDTEKITKETSESVVDIYTNIQTINSAIAKMDAVYETTAYIRSGLLDYEGEKPIYGIEVGQEDTKEENGEVVTVFNKYARFTSDRLSFYDASDNEVAYISDRKLYIKNVEVTVSYTIGYLQDKVIDNGSVVTKYIGGVD